MSGGGGGDQVVGTRYKATVHYGVIKGEVDELLNIVSDGKIAWAGRIKDNLTKRINARGLFGGDKKEGGIVADMHVLFGKKTQMPHPAITKGRSKDIPAYRGIFSFILAGQLVCNLPRLKEILVCFKCIKSGWKRSGGCWYPEKASIITYEKSFNRFSENKAGFGIVIGNWVTNPVLTESSVKDKDYYEDMNPAHIVYKTLLEAGVKDSNIDQDSFKKAADTFYEEKFGLSALVNEDITYKAFIARLEDIAMFNLVRDRKTGKYKINLIRDDYDVSKLKIISDDMIIDVSYEMPSSADTVNRVSVTYTNVEDGKQLVLPSIDDLGNIETYDMPIKHDKVQYNYITSKSLAAQVGTTYLKNRSQPFFKVDLICNRKAFEILQGDVFILTIKKIGIEKMVMRALDVELGTITDGKIKISAVQDVFGMQYTSFVEQETSGWIPSINMPSPSPIRFFEELNYYDMQRFFSVADINTFTKEMGFVFLSGSRPSTDSGFYTLYLSLGNSDYQESGIGTYAPICILKKDIGYIDTEIEIDPVVDIDYIELNTYAVIDGKEYVRIDNIDTVNNKIKIGRGILDTVALRHTKGVNIIFCGTKKSINRTPFLLNESVNAKCITNTGAGNLELSIAPVDNLKIKARWSRPYPPGKLRINTAAYPEYISPGENKITWASRNKLAQNLESEESDNITVDNILYAIEIKDSKGKIIFSKNDIALNEYVFETPENEHDFVTLKLWSIDDGIESYTYHNVKLKIGQL